MINYSEGKIYTIRCKTDPKLIYVGSTVSSLTGRWYGHKNDHSRRNSKINTTMKEIGSENFYIELYELYPCNLKIELEKREGEFIRLIGTLNEKIAGRDKKQYYNENLEKIRANQEKYYIENKHEIRANQHQYSIQNRENKKDYDKQYREINKEKIKNENH